MLCVIKKYIELISIHFKDCLNVHQDPVNYPTLEKYHRSVIFDQFVFEENSNRENHVIIVTSSCFQHLGFQNVFSPRENNKACILNSSRFEERLSRNDPFS